MNSLMVPQKDRYFYGQRKFSMETEHWQPQIGRGCPETGSNRLEGEQ